MAFQADQQQISFLLGKKIYSIPRNQRKYVWKAENWKNLLEDLDFLRGTTGKAHFLGSIVLNTQTNHNNDDIEYYEIVDGQQRITTIVMILVVIAQIFKERGEYALFQSLLSYIQTTNINNKTSCTLNTDVHTCIMNLVSHVANRESPYNTMQLLITNCITNKKQDDVIEECLKYFYDNLSNRNTEEVASFRNSLISANYVNIRTTDEDAYTVFEILNASGDNTNFIFEVTGNMDDEKMEHFNNIFKTAVRKGEICFDIATAERMQYLHQIGCDIQFVGTAKNEARTNLIKCGGMEMPMVMGGMLKKFYYENLSGPTSVEDCIDYLAKNDIASYGFDDLKNTYRGKIAHFFLCAFTGMRLGSPWNGRQEVNGGYIVVKNNGDVVAFHSTIADEFKDFLVAKMRMESPSHSRHKDMVIYKEDDRYFLKLALQLRFTLSR